jgi:hypothetical protein
MFIARWVLSPWWSRRYVPQKCRFMQEPHDIASQKLAVFTFSFIYRMSTPVLRPHRAWRHAIAGIGTEDMSDNNKCLYFVALADHLLLSDTVPINIATPLDTKELWMLYKQGLHHRHTFLWERGVRPRTCYSVSCCKWRLGPLTSKAASIKFGSCKGNMPVQFACVPGSPVTGISDLGDHPRRDGR